MKKYTCIIVDDEPLARELLTAHIAKIPDLQLVATCGSAVEAREALRAHAPDILFLDIQMPHLTGLELLRMLTNQPKTILTTAYAQYALDAFALSVVDYLLKPIEFERFFKAVSKALDLLAVQQVPVPVLPPQEVAPSADYFYVKSDYKIVKVVYDEILYVEALQKYVRIHTLSDRIVSLLSMSQLEQSLPSGQFFRVHRSYLVNLNKIEKIDSHEIHIGKIQIPISKGQWDAFMDRIKEKGLGW